MRDARAIAAYLHDEYGARVFGVGLLFEPDRRFGDRSDIDLVVEGLPAARYFEASAKAAAMTNFDLDLIPLEDATDYMREVVDTRGVPL